MVTPTSSPAAHRTILLSLLSLTTISLEVQCSGNSETVSPESKYIFDVYDKIRRGESFQEATGLTLTRHGNTLRAIPAKTNIQFNLQYYNFCITLLPSDFPSNETVYQITIRFPLPINTFRIQFRMSVELALVKYDQVISWKRFVLTVRKSSPTSSEGVFSLSPSDFNTWVSDYLPHNLALRVNLAFITSTKQQPNSTFNHRVRRSSTVSKPDSAVVVVLSESGDNFVKDISNGQKLPSFGVTSLLMNSLPKKSSAKETVPMMGQFSACRPIEYWLDLDRLNLAPWILFPRQFLLSYCSGGCQGLLTDAEQPTNHARMLSMAATFAGRSQFQSSCCAPTEYEPLYLIYWEEGRLVLRKHTNIAVKACGCK